ncbi:MAG: hypothetical protein IJN42_06145 [Clostridia bacterium]|nr:hypothetical protein [Clostridia bacterium]
MKEVSDNAMLQYINKASETGVRSIKDVLEVAKGEKLRKQLKEQQLEYGELYADARAMLRRRGEEPRHLSRSAKMNVKMGVRMGTMLDRSPSKIAEMMIRGNTMGMTQSIKTLNHYSGNNEQIRSMAVKLLRTEQANIDSLKSYL